MGKSFIVLAGIILAANAVAAEKTSPFKNQTAPRVEPTDATSSAPPTTGSSSTTVKISADDCARLVAHKPRADVAYKPGVDVDGKYVAAADTNSTYAAINAPTKVEFDIAFNPLHAALAGRLSETSLSIGRVSYDIDSGAMTYNGKPLSDPDKVTLGKRCRDKLNQ